jgi:hypothetical protein
MKPRDLIKLIYQEAVENGVTSAEKQGWLHTLTLKNGVVVEARSVDEGYTQSIYVKGLVSASLCNEGTYKESVGFMLGDDKGLLSIARMRGLTFNGELV